MFIVAILNESNIYEKDSEILENPVCFTEFSDAIKFAQPLIEQGYEVVIKREKDN